ncbi:peptidoglycan-binding domain-containing protein [Allorhizocola rhizosphaerae]|uniref:peptidoglycan-binding domain-containing protein n=1 Tax=Allorhizocola rhizosphaerae TaxID=1872709 RepID=UPI0013C30123|nr:peptidoglycan-binding domain-containing protein [Allorhizocola rhizosphaerae]
MGLNRRAVVMGAVGGTALATAAGMQFVLARQWTPAVPPVRVPAATARVLRETLTLETVLPGRLGFGTRQVFESKAIGTVTWLPPAGAVISRGEQLLRADDRPVVALYGPLPMYRPLGVGVEGNDVTQLEGNLKALGHNDFAVDRGFNAATERAVKRWQRDLGLAETGVADATWVAYVDGPIRVAERKTRVGAAATGQMFTYTATTKVVTVDARADELAWAVKDSAVTIRLPDGGEVEGIVTAVGDLDGTGEAGATVAVTIAPRDQARVGALERTPVEVSRVAQRREGVLTVPVTALLAVAEGGYGLEVVSGSDSRIVTVQTGLVAGGRVEVPGEGLAEGMLVGLPE